MVKEKPETASLEELAERIAQYANDADEKTIGRQHEEISISNWNFISVFMMGSGSC